MGKKDARKNAAETAATDERIALAGAVLLLVVAALVAYGNSFSAAFQFDDVAGFLKSPDYAPRASNFMKHLTSPRAVAHLSLFLNRAILGDGVGGFHAVNLLVHLGASLALLGVLRRTPGAKPLALPAALLFLVHPLQTESVTYIAQRAQALMGFFELASLYCFARSQTEERRAPWQAGAVVAFGCGMLSKPHLVLYPLLVLLYDRAFFAASVKEAVARARGLYGALFATWALGALYVAYHLIIRGKWVDVGEGGRTPLGYAWTQAFAIPFYAWLAVFPRALCIDYFWKEIPAWKCALGAVATLALAAGSAVAWRRSRALGFLGAWFFLNLLPVSSVIPRPDLVVEHRMYVPLAALAVLAAALGSRFERRTALAALAVVVVVLVARTRARNEDYATPRTLWAATVEVAPWNPRAHHNLATAYKEAGELERSLQEFGEAVRLDPGYAYAWNDRGDVRTRLGRHREALEDYTHAAEKPEIAALAFYNRGNAHRALKEPREAAADYTQALERNSAFVEAVYNRGCAWQDLNEHEKAIADFTAALALRADLAGAHTNRGSALLKLGKTAEARADFERAIQIAPASPEAYINRAVVHGNEKRYDEAWADLKRARDRGGVPPPELLTWLRSVSGRSE